MKDIFYLKENKTNIKTEFVAGLTTFCAIVYILMVVANMFSNPYGTGENVLGLSYGAIYIGVAISAIIGTLLMGLLANLPIAQASGMGTNAFFVYSACLGFGLSYENALVLIFADGLLFIILTATGAIEKIYAAIPEAVREAITVGLGLFIAMIGLQNSGIIVSSPTTGVTLASFNLLQTGWAQIMPMCVTILSLIAIIVMVQKNIRAAVVGGLALGMVMYYLLGLTIPGFYSNLNIQTINPLDAFQQFNTECLGVVFTKGFDFSNYIAQKGSANLFLIIATTSLAFCMADMFNTLGTLYATCDKGGMLLKDGSIPNMNKAMMSGAIATSAGAVCGVPTVTTFTESVAGVAVGGRTGLSSVFIALFFVIVMFLSPLAQLVPNCATGAVLIYVGFLMTSSVKNFDWSNVETSLPAFLTIIITPLAYNIAYGIAFGIISYVVVMLLIGKSSQVKTLTWIIAILFITTLLFTN